MEPEIYIHLLRKAATYRGEVINETIWIEKCIDAYIAKYFCKDDVKAREMHLLILGDNRMTFDNKKQVFDFLAKTYDLEWYKSYISPRDDNRKKGRIPLSGDLDYIITQRNILAHCMLDTRDDSINAHDTDVKLTRFKNEYQSFDFTPEKLNLIHQILSKAGVFFKDRMTL